MAENTEINYMFMLDIFHRMYALNKDYQEIVKPLIATIESMSEKMPISIFNESRAFTDHIGRCYINYNNKDYIDEQLKRAERHVNRMIMDCYKTLFIIYNQRVEEFKKHTKYVDLLRISDGKFYVEYKQLLSKAEQSKLNAKRSLSYEEEDYRPYEEAYLAYYKLDEHIQNHLLEIKNIKWKWYIGKLLGGLGWVIATVLGALLSNNNQEIVRCIIELFKSS